MRQTFTIRFLGDDQTAQTIVVNSKKGLTPTYIGEYRGKEGSERYCISYAVTAVGVLRKTKEELVLYRNNGNYVVGLELDYSNSILSKDELYKRMRIQPILDTIKPIQPRKWYQFWRKK